MASLTPRRFILDHPSTLVRLQTEHWDPLHAWYKEHHGVDIKTYDTLVLGGGNRFKQDEKTKQVLRDIVNGWDSWQVAGKSSFSPGRATALMYRLTALERATYSTKSFLIAFALVSGKLTADQASRAAQVEVSSQIELWGEVEDSELRLGVFFIRCADGCRS
jgi:ATP synthase F1 complex assembly factor 2